MSDLCLVETEMRSSNTRSGRPAPQRRWCDRLHTRPSWRRRLQRNAADEVDAHDSARRPVAAVRCALTRLLYKGAHLRIGACVEAWREASRYAIGSALAGFTLRTVPRRVEAGSQTPFRDVARSLAPCGTKAPFEGVPRRPAASRGARAIAGTGARRRRTVCTAIDPDRFGRLVRARTIGLGLN